MQFKNQTSKQLLVINFLILVQLYQKNIFSKLVKQKKLIFILFLLLYYLIYFELVIYIYNIIYKNKINKK